MGEAAAEQSRKDLYNAINKAALVIFLWTLVDKILAVGKEMLLAREFGIDASLDVFNLAYTVPGIITLLLNNAFFSAFIPLYLEWRHTLPQHLVRDNVMTVFIASIFGVVVVTLAGWLSAPWFFPLLGYGMGQEQQQLGIALERLLLIVVMLEGVSGLFAALLQAWKTFAAVTFAQSFINISLILFLLYGAKYGIDLLAWGTIYGCAAKLLFLALCVGRRTFASWRPFTLRISVLRPYFAIVVPLLGSALIVNSILMVDQSMATQFSPGGVSSLRYAFRINDLPLQLVIIAISRAIFPYISESAAQDDQESMRHVFKRAMIFVGLITFPIMVFVFVFAPDVVSVLLRRGAFGEDATLRTAITLQSYVLGLYFFAYTFINSAFFTALQKVKTLFIMGVFSLLLNVGLNWLFIHLLKGVYGIALSSSVGSAIICLIFIILLHRNLQLNITLSELRSLGLPLILAAGLGLGCYPFKGVIVDTGMGHAVSLTAWGTAYFGCYGLLLYFFRTPEWVEVLSMGRMPRFLKRLLRKDVGKNLRSTQVGDLGQKP